MTVLFYNSCTLAILRKGSYAYISALSVNPLVCISLLSLCDLCLSVRVTAIADSCISNNRLLLCSFFL